MSVQDMTDQQLNQELAALLGYTIKTTNTTIRYYFLYDPEGKRVGKSCASEAGTWSLYAPKYCSDPVDSLKVQEAAIETDVAPYVSYLHKIITGIEEEFYSDVEVADMLTATPRQRAEAAYQTLAKGAKR